MEVPQKPVLVLDAGMQPVRVANWDAVMVMWSTDKIDILEEYDEVIHSAYLEIRIPSVVRLREPVKRKIKPVKFSRVNVYARDKYLCQYCGQKCSMNDLTYDHVIPRSQGGKTTWTNIVSACRDCNAHKACRTPAQAKMRLLKPPVQPVAVPTVGFRIMNERAPEAWRDYLYWSGSLDE